MVSTSIGYSKNSSSGYSKKADASKGKYYRPKLVGDTYYRRYKIQEYSPITGKLVKTYYKEIGYSKDVTVEMAYKQKQK